MLERLETQLAEAHDRIFGLPPGTLRFETATPLTE
jgi:hypothetical protein